MNIAYKYLLYVCMATCFMQVGCTDEVHLNRDDGEEDVVVENYLRLTISSPEAKHLTRSNPTGGENGDGYEPGQDYETRIDDLMLLFYQGTDGVNSPASTPIDKIMYLDRDAMEGDNRTEPVLVGLPGGWYDLLVITNTGNIRSQLQGMTLGGVRDYLQKRAWTENGGKYSRFVMASDGHLDTQVYICGENTIDNPASATVEVERHAARIDYQLVHKYYDVTDKTAGEAQVSITGVLIVNKLDAGSYMLKRVIGAASDGSYGAENTLKYLGLELPEWGDHQTNYVLDPWSRKKTLANVNRRVLIRNSLPVPDNRLLRFMKTILRATVHRYPTGSLLPVWVNVWVTGTVWVTRKKIRWQRRNNRLTSIRESYLKLLMDLRNALFMIRFPVKRSNGRAWMEHRSRSLHTKALYTTRRKLLWPHLQVTARMWSAMICR